MRVSLIISIYNSPEFLDRVLCSVSKQKKIPEETIVSEDGAFIANAGVVNQWKAKWPKNSKLIHLTQRDHGNRKPLAMNKAVARSLGDYLVFVDGDCVLRSDFISDHMAFAEEGCFLTGRRVELSAKASQRLTVDSIKRDYLEKFPWALIFDSLIGQTRHIGRFFRPPRLLRGILRRNHVLDIRGCNFSVFRGDLIAINGFSNDFSGAYGEDSEVEIRLKSYGLKMKSIKNAAIQYHLWHPTQMKDPINQSRLLELTVNPRVRTPNGLEESLNIP